MAIATINVVDTQTDPARPEIVYDKLDLRKLAIRERNGKYEIRGVYLQLSSATGDQIDEKDRRALKFHIEDFGEYLKTRPNLKTAIRAFVRLLAAEIQIPEPEPDPPVFDDGPPEDPYIPGE